MNRVTIHQFSSLKQERQEGVFTMKGLAFTQLLHNIIREYGKYDDNNFKVDIDEIENIDKKLLLSHFISMSEYEWMLERPSRLETCFSEYKNYLQTLINNECREVYQDDMESHGMRKFYADDNGEEFWTRR